MDTWYNLSTCQGRKPDLCFKSTDQTATHNRISLCAECARYGFRLTLAGSLVSWRAHSAFKESMVKAICQQCGKEFDARPWNSGKFCSHACSGASRKNSVDASCPVCGRRFGVPPSIYHATRCCSKECATVLQTKKVKRLCQQCGKGFSAKASEVGKYCSPECSALGSRKQEHRICKTCGKEFFTTPSLIKRNADQYCSNKCKGRGRSGENSTFYVHGQGRFPYPAEFNESFKVAIRERDNYTCAVCGGWGNDVHHINYVKGDTFPENCITLCHSCHRKTGFNRVDWQRRFEGLMKRRGSL